MQMLWSVRKKGPPYVPIHLIFPCPGRQQKTRFYHEMSQIHERPTVYTKKKKITMCYNTKLPHKLLKFHTVTKGYI